MPVGGSDYVFKDDVPTWVPSSLRPWAGDLTYNEFHAMVLGVPGILAGPALRLGFIMEVAFFTGVFVALGFGFRRVNPDTVPRVEGAGILRSILRVVSQISGNVAAKTVAREPWYFLSIYTLLFVVSWILYPIFA